MKKLHMQIKGNIRKGHYSTSAKNHAKKLGLINSVIVVRESYLEMDVEGEKEKLWKMLHWAKKGPMFSYVKEILFHFSPPADVA